MTRWGGRVTGECSHTRVTPRVLVNNHCLRCEMRGYICCRHDDDDDTVITYLQNIKI
jgi:hypothetical protein